MIHEIFDFFPFNIDSGPTFLFLYLVLSAFGMVLSAVARNALGRGDM